MIPVFLALAWPALAALFAPAYAADDQPGWFQKDYRSPSEWGFYCAGNGKSEGDALQSARLECAQKICMLFGVEVEAQVQSTEGLKDSSVTSTTVEKCPKVRVVGRVEKKKTVECEESACQGFVYQTYPKSEYDREYKRLNEPAISKVLEKTIIVREGNETFRDPKTCEDLMAAYGALTGETTQASQDRVAVLTKATDECKGLDYRDSRIQGDLNQKMMRPLISRDMSSSVLLSQRLSTASSIEDRVKILLEFEKGKLASGPKLEELRKMIAQRFDAFSTEIHYDSERKGYVLSDGSVTAVSPYLTEVNTCRASSELIRRWPNDVTQDITVCSISNPTSCVKLSILQLRAQWSGCLCRQQYKGRESDCTRELYQALGDACPSVVNSACLKKTDSRMAERAGESPFGRFRSSERLKEEILFMLMKMLIVLAILAFGPSALAKNSDCADKTYKGEGLLSQGDTANAESVLKDAVKVCRAAGEKSARPYVALGTLYVQLKRPEPAVPLFEEALKNEPGLPLAYVDLSAAYQELGQYDKSVEQGKKGIDAAKGSGDTRLQAEANYNVGFALFNAAAKANSTNDLRSESFFLASQKLDPSIGANYFYLGVLAEVIKKDPKSASTYYRQGCDKKYPQACTYLGNLRARLGPEATGGAATGGVAAAPVAVSSDEKALYTQIRAKFIARGVPPATVDQMIQKMQANYANLPPDSRKNALRSLASQ